MIYKCLSFHYNFLSLLFKHPMSATVAKRLSNETEYPGSRLKKLKTTKDVRNVCKPDRVRTGYRPGTVLERYVNANPFAVGCVSSIRK